MAVQGHKTSQDSTDVERSSSVRSFVRREGRITPSQRRALDELWSRYGIDPAGQPLRLEEVFGRRAPVTLEIGFGDGSSLLAQATAAPERDFLGIEVHAPGVGQLLRRIEESGMTNLRVMRLDAVEVLSGAIAPRALDTVQIFFPDPWPKKRHHKRRLVQPHFLDSLARALRAGGTLHLATDWADYAEHMQAVVGAHPGFAALADRSESEARLALRPETRFERRGRRLGHQVWDLLYRRLDGSDHS